MLQNKEPRGEPSPICAQSIIPIDISKLVPFHSNPFIRENDPTINELVCSIRNCGIITPLEVRPIVNDQYQIISGYRRYKAALICGLDVVPSLILDQTEDEAIIHMIDCNIQRENILPSEKAFAYKLKLEAIKRIKQNKKIAPKISARYRSDDDLGLIYGVSGDTVRNYILLTRLHPDLLKMVDEKKIGLSIAYKIANLSMDEQMFLLTAIESEQAYPSLSQIIQIENLRKTNSLNADEVLSIMIEQKKPIKNEITLSADKIRKFFPKNYTTVQIEEKLIYILEAWSKFIRQKIRTTHR